MKNTYLIPVSYTVGGTVEVNADSIEEAEKKALKRLDEDGEEAIKSTVHREFFTC